jgi:hypothetical protein
MSIALEMSLKDAQLLVGLQNQQKAIERNEKSIERAAKAAGAWEAQLKKTEKAAASDAWANQLKKTAAAQEANAKAAIDSANKVAEARRKADAAAVGKVTADTATPLEKYKVAVAELTRLKNEAGLSQEAYNRAVANEKRLVQDALGITQQRAAASRELKKQQQETATAEKRAAEEAKRFGDETRKLVATPAERYKLRMEELRRSLKAGTIDQETFNRASRRAQHELNATGKAGLFAFGPQALSMMASYVGAAALAAKGVQSIGEAIQFANQQREAAGQSLQGEFETYRELNQISSDENYEERKVQYKRLREHYGLDQQTARELQFMGISTGNEESIERFAQTRAAMNPATAMRVGSHLETLFRGEVNEVEAANMMKTAADKSRNTVEQFAPALPTAASAAAAQGSTAAETLALVSVLSDVYTGPQQAAERINFMAVKMATDERFAGLGVLEGWKKLESMDEEDQVDFLGSRQELKLSVINIRAQEEKIRERLAEIEESRSRAMTDDSELARGQRRFEGDDEGRAMLEHQKAKQAEEMGKMEAFGVGQSDLETYRARAREEAIRRGDSGASRWLQDKMAGLEGWVWGDADEAAAGTAAARWMSDPTAQGNPLKFLEYLAEEQERANEVRRGGGDEAAIMVHDPEAKEQTGLLREIKEALQRFVAPQPGRSPNFFPVPR